MATASSSPTDPEVAALIRAHAFAMVAAGAVAAACGAFAYLQLLSPGILGDAAWLGVGRLRFAGVLVMLCGWLGNALVICFYVAFPWMGRLVVRWGVGALKFGVWNFVITAPVVLMSLCGIVPPARVLPAWFALSSMPPGMAHASGFGFALSSVFIILRPTLGVRLRSFELSFAMIAFGTLGLVIAGIGGDAAQNLAIHSGRPWLDVLAGLHGYWIADSFSYLVIVWGCVLAMVAFSPPADSVRARDIRLPRWLLGLVIFGILIQPVAVYFTETLDASTTPTTTSEIHGRSVFVREGCASCHGDADRSGIGPDLSRESGARPADWHFAHLFAPRTVTPLSVMPSYAHLFTGAADQPTQEARDLVAYLESLGRAKELGAPAADATALRPAGMNPARARRTGATPSISGTGNQVEGLRLFATYCVGCHGPKGEGDGRAASALRPKPANLAAHRYTEEQIGSALWNGVAGTAMPAWRDQPLDRLAHLITAVQTLGQSNAGLGEQAGLRLSEADLGARVYAANCTQCHGERGGGDGFSAASLTVTPANFQRQQPSLDYALRAIAGGVEGTPMAPWTSRISEQELLAVAHYVRSFYTGGVK